MLEFNGCTYCRRCKRINKLNYFISINNKDMSSNFEATIINSITEKKLSKICNCGGQLEIIDSKIASTISLLNIKGYETVDCSDSLTYNYEFPYITFRSSVPAKIFNSLPYPWKIDFDIDNNKNEYVTIRFEIDEFPINIDSESQRDLFMWAANLPFIENPASSSDDAKMRAFVEYFLDEKYWHISYNKRYSGHCYRNSPYETDTSCDNCDGALCEDCKLIKNLEYEFCCPVDKYAEAIELIFGYDHKRAEEIAYSDYKCSPIIMPSKYHLKTYFPEFLDKISTLQGFNRDLFEKIKNEYKSLIDAYPDSSKQNSTFHHHFLNQYQLYKYIKDKEKEEK